jgi:hypothetical protein
MDNQWTTTDRQFGAALRALLSDRPEFLTKTGNINWASVAEAMPIYYETLRKAVAGERQPSRPLMELAAKLGWRQGNLLRGVPTLRDVPSARSRRSRVGGGWKSFVD